MNIKTQTESPYNPEVLSVVFSAVSSYQEPVKVTSIVANENSL